MNTQPNTEVRNSNLELYRIIVMIMIIAHHYVVNSGLPDLINNSPVTDNSLFFSVFGSLGKTGIINSLASCCFGVLIIHAFSDGMRLLLWHVIFDCAGHYNTALYWIYAPMSVMIVFSVCACIELIRIKTIETPMLNWAENRVRTIILPLFRTRQT